MDSVLNILTQGWIGTAVGFVGIVLAVVFYFRSRRKARLAFQCDHVTLVGGRGAAFSDEVEISFAGTVVPRITASRIIIWNCGDRTINRRDLVEGDPLRVEVPETGRILKHMVLRQTRSVNAWHFDQPSPNLLNLTFDFLDPGDGVSLEIIHSEPRDELHVVGTIRGIPGGLLSYRPAFWSFLYRRRDSLPFPIRSPRIMLSIGIAIGALLMLFGLFRPQLAQWFPSGFGPTEPIDPERTIWAFVFLGFLYAALPAFLLWSRRRRYPTTLEPEQADDGGEQDAASSAA